MKKILVLDLETTGFSRDWDYIIEIAGVMYDADTDAVLDEFHEYIKPAKKIPVKVVELTGITDQKVKNCRSEREVMADFAEWIAIERPDIILGHNCKAFDLSFIRKKCERYHIGWYETEIIDTLTIARDLAKKGRILVLNCKQETLAEYFGIKYNAHSALNDVRALIQIYACLQKITQPTIKDLGF